MLNIRKFCIETNRKCIIVALAREILAVGSGRSPEIYLINICKFMQILNGLDLDPIAIHLTIVTFDL